MTLLPKLILKPGREKSVLNHHPWIFSGAIARVDACENGSLVSLYDASGVHLGSGYYNSRCSIAARIVSFDNRPPEQAIADTIRAALAYRTTLLDSNTTGMRLINGEGDGLPGLIVDRYSDVLVMQIGTLGIDRIRESIIKHFVNHSKPRAMYEKSTTSSRKEEGLTPREGWVYGEDDPRFNFLENGMRFGIDLRDCQKTGFYLDQREMRALIRTLAKGRKVLNCFSYTGGFSVAAALGGAVRTASVDISPHAIELAKAHFRLNDIDLSAHEFVVADVFDYLRTLDSNTWDLLILDPPAFAKKREHIEQACRGYGEVNRLALAHLPKGGMLLTSSCSAHMSSHLFQQLLFQAARDAGREVQIIHRHRLAFDHPICVYHPEGEYLKSVLLRVV